MLALVSTLFVELIRSLLSVPVDNVVITPLAPLKLLIFAFELISDEEEILIDLRLLRELLVATRLLVVRLSLANVEVLISVLYKLLEEIFEPTKFEIVDDVAENELDILRLDVVNELVATLVEIIFGAYKLLVVAYVDCKLDADI